MLKASKQKVKYNKWFIYWTVKINNILYCEKLSNNLYTNIWEKGLYNENIKILYYYFIIIHYVW